MILVPDPALIGRALADVRALHQLGRRDCARLIADATGRTETSVNAQLWTWDTGGNIPDLASLPPYLDVLGVVLALEYKPTLEET